MSSLLKWKHRSSRDHGLPNGFGGDSEKIIAKKVIQATSPELDKPSSAQLNEIVSHIASREAAETEAAIRALKHRLTDYRPRVVLNTLAVADHVLRNLTEGRTSTSNFRSYLETVLLPRVQLLAKGLPASSGDKPSPVVRSAALDTLQNWSSPTFLNGALLKRPAFAEAYRDASLHTPSPPAPTATSASGVSSTPKRAPVRLPTPNGGGRMPSSLRASTPNSVAAAAADPAAAGTLHAPKEDNAFVNYYRKRLVSFDTLHVVNKVPLTDKRIVSLRAFIEGHLERLRKLADNSGSAEHKRYAGLVQYAQSKLCTFPDYRPTSAGASTTSGPAPPPSPPPPASFTPRPGTGQPSCDSISGQVGPSHHPQPQQPPGHSAPVRTQGSSNAQRRMLVSLAMTFASPTQHPRMPQPHWTEAHFANLPVNLVNLPTRPQADPGASAAHLQALPPPPPPPHQGIPRLPTQQPPQPLHYQMQRPQPTMYGPPPHVMTAQHPHPHRYQYAQYPSSGLM